MIIIYAEFAQEIGELLAALNDLIKRATERAESHANNDGAERPYILSGKLEVGLDGGPVGVLVLEDEWWLFDDTVQAPVPQAAWADE